MKKIIYPILLILILVISDCKKGTNSNIKGTCSDGILNQNETAIDCGGVCSKCPTCTDGIQNQGETGIDCGGPCGNCKILYPDSGLFGRNLLKLSNDTITIKANTWFSALAILGPQTAIRVRVSNPQGIGINWWFSTSLGNWYFTGIDANTQELKASNSLSFKDVEFGFQTTNNGVVRFEIFENNSTKVTRTILIYWFS
jgi:hypothetical protein